jgi:hypothetical protein
VIGVKSIAIVVVAGAAIAGTIATGSLSMAHFEELTIASAFAIGLFASTAAALVAYGARPSTKSRAAVVLSPKPALAVDLARSDARVRELPSVAQRGLLVAMFACLGLGTFSSDATARIASAPADFTEPSRAAYCLPDSPKPVEEAPVPEAPPPVVVDQAGCALVKRAFALGYAKSLGTCAPKAAPVPKAEPKVVVKEVCDRRELDEPFLHYTWRRVVEAFEGASPIDAASTRVEDLRTRVDYLDDLLADIKHSVTGTPHGSHHVWITLPDPHPKSALDVFTGHEPCTSTFADLALWPAWSPATSPSVIVEHVLGQLLFATRFGTPASCSDYTLHWDAPKDACTKLAADPSAFLDEHDALDPIRDVLDRRKRQAALRALALALGHEPTINAPPPASAVVSVACFVVDAGAASAAGRQVTLDGETITVREARVAAIAGTGAGPFDVYAKLAELFAGTKTAAPREATEPVDLGADFPLARLEPLVDVDPLVDRTVRPLLDRADVREVYPFDQHLHAFVEDFRRVYFAQRGRL